MRNDLNTIFIEDHDCFFIQQGEWVQGKKAESEVKISNALFNKMNDHPGSEIFNNVCMGGIELDHVIKSKSGITSVIEIHGF